MNTETLEAQEQQFHQLVDIHFMFVSTPDRVRKYNQLRIIGACNRFWMRRGTVDPYGRVRKAAQGKFIRNVM